MDSADEDMFAFSDAELPISSPKCNPVEEHLMKQLSDVETRIEKTTNDIKEVRDTTGRILKSLYNQAQYGEDLTSDSDSDLYTIDGQPVIKKRKQKVHKPKHQILVVQNTWKCIVYDQWVIGVVLENTSIETLSNVQIYISIKGEDEIRGISTFWYLRDEVFWRSTETIEPRQRVIATVALFLPQFDKQSFCDAYGTVSYEIEEKQYQTPVPTIRLTAAETIDHTNGIKFSSELNRSILALKITSIEKTVAIQMEEYVGGETQLLEFLEEKSFIEISPNVYVVKTTGCLIYCLAEIMPLIDGEARLNIFSRSSQQMNIVTRLLKDQFPNMRIEEDINPVRAAMALIEELKLYLGDSSPTERQIARIRTDLLIP